MSVTKNLLRVSIEPPQFCRDVVRDEPRLLRFHLTIHDASQHEGVRVPVEIIQQSVSLGDPGNRDMASWLIKQSLAMINQSVSYGLLVHFCFYTRPIYSHSELLIPLFRGGIGPKGYFFVPGRIAFPAAYLHGPREASSP